MKPDPFQIRPATTQDISFLLPLIEAYWNFEGIRGFSPETISKKLSLFLSNSRLGQGWVAFQERKAIGYLFIVYVFSLEHLGMTAEVDEFFVTPEGRRQGLGHSLFIFAKDIQNDHSMNC